jgi:hypothetical protein
MVLLGNKVLKDQRVRMALLALKENRVLRV